MAGKNRKFADFPAFPTLNEDDITINLPKSVKKKVSGAFLRNKTIISNRKYPFLKKEEIDTKMRRKK